MTEQVETEYVELELPCINISIDGATQFIREVHPWVIRHDLDLRIIFRFPEADGLVTRPHFAGGPSVQVKIEVRKDQYEAASAFCRQIAGLVG